ncbi:hypothetical protein [Pseudoalteromonas sp. T1lg48]|uniref:hypothetical protein n=1 Tax=Pseudoalteromonas sp. T1lg48 TaxID=2077100 RepID=UPI001F1962FE|nr:hypothetical protein [Pseudoalteromonas sp. T1lg48]
MGDKTSAMLVQKHQLDNAEGKLAELDAALDSLIGSQSGTDEQLDSMLESMGSLLLESGVDFNDDTQIIDPDIQEYVSDREGKSGYKYTPIDMLSSVDISDQSSWDDYIQSVNHYANKHHVDLVSDPFDRLLSPIQKINLEKRIKDDFSYKNAKCDKYDYLIAGTCGLIGGLVDVFFVGAPGEGPLGKAVDYGITGTVSKFAEAVGFDRKEKEGDGYKKYFDKCIAKNKSPLDKETWMDTQAVQFLEGKFAINYDQTLTKPKGKTGTGGLVGDLKPKNHHLKSIGHSPDLIGLFFSVYNQFTSTSSFVSNGKLITIDTETFELKGNTAIAKIFCGFVNWLGHLFSDMAGSNSSIAKGNRGSGIPIPFYNLLLLLDVGEFGKHKQTFATIATKVFEQGYDFRHGLAMAIPVMISELLTRIMWTCKARFYHKRPWKECIPSANNPELRRMLLVAHGTLCLVDTSDAALKSGGDMVQFLLRTNLIGWVRFGNLALKEMVAWHHEGHIDPELVDNYLDAEYSRMLKRK